MKTILKEYYFATHVRFCKIRSLASVKLSWDPATLTQQGVVCAGNASTGDRAQGSLPLTLATGHFPGSAESRESPTQGRSASKRQKPGYLHSGEKSLHLPLAEYRTINARWIEDFKCQSEASTFKKELASF